MEYLKFTSGTTGMKIAYRKDIIIGVQQDMNSPTHSLLIVEDQDCGVIPVDEDFITVCKMLNGID